jgi:hypothetical protein
MGNFILPDGATPLPRSLPPDRAMPSEQRIADVNTFLTPGRTRCSTRPTALRSDMADERSGRGHTFSEWV